MKVPLGQAAVSRVSAMLQRPVRGWLRNAADAAGLLLLAFFLYGVVVRNIRTQADFHVYHTAGVAILHGIDPYVRGNLTGLSDRTVFPFLYPPIVLLPCIAVAGVSAATAKVVWIWSQVVLLGALVVAWAKWLNRGAMILPTALVATFGWNSSAQRNLVTGNIAILEAALIWAGMAFLLAGRRRLFACFIVTAALCKLAPAAFLILLLVPMGGRKPDWKLFAASSAVLSVLVFGPMLVGPFNHLQPFWDGIPNWTMTGPDNPTVIGFTLSLLSLAGVNVSGVPHVYFWIWLSYAALLGAVSYPYLRRCYEARDPRQWVMTAVFMYMLLMPRPMAYGFVMLAPVPLFFSPRPFDTTVGRWMLAVALSAQGILKQTSIASTSPFFVYAPFLLMLCVWLLVIDAPLSPRAPSLSARESDTERMRLAA